MLLLRLSSPRMMISREALRAESVRIKVLHYLDSTTARGTDHCDARRGLAKIRAAGIQILTVKNALARATFK